MIRLYAGAAAGAVLALLAAGTFNALYLLPKARAEGRALYIAEQAVASVKAEMARKSDDRHLQGISDYELCVVALGRVPECDALKL